MPQSNFVTQPSPCSQNLWETLLLSTLNVIRHLICTNTELASELVDGGQDTMNCGRKRLVDFNAVKTQLVLFDQSKSTGDIDVKMDGSIGLSLAVQWLVAVQPCMESQ